MYIFHEIMSNEYIHNEYMSICIQVYVYKQVESYFKKVVCAAFHLTYFFHVIRHFEKSWFYVLCDHFFEQAAALCLLDLCAFQVSKFTAPG